MILLVITGFLVILPGCTTYNVMYEISLKEVERPVRAKERYGERNISKVEEEGSKKYYFEDELVKITWIPTASQFSIILTNKTDHSIKIVWDEAAYVDENGASHRIMHSGVKFIDRNNSQPPSIVVRKGYIADLIIPTDKVQWDNQDYKSSWHAEPIFPFDTPINLELKTEEELKTKNKDYVGKTVQVLLPLQIEDAVSEYIFIFEIKNIEIKKIEPTPVPLRRIRGGWG